MENKLITKICSKCGKEFVSLYANQLQQNYEQHMAKHEREEREKDGKTNDKEDQE